MKEIFPWIFAAALLLAGSAFLYAGVKLTSTAWTLKTSGEQTTATIERVEVREAHVRKDDAPAIVHYYTEVVSFTAWDGSKVEARLPEKNDDEARGSPGDPIEIRYRHDDPSVAAPVNGSPLGIQGADPHHRGSGASRLRRALDDREAPLTCTAQNKMATQA